MEASPCRPAEEAEREGDEKLVFAGAEQSLIWSSGAVFSLSLSLVRRSSSPKSGYKVGAGAGEDVRPSQHIYIFCSDVGILSPGAVWQATLWSS